MRYIFTLIHHKQNNTQNNKFPKITYNIATMQRKGKKTKHYELSRFRIRRIPRTRIPMH
mgnify:FL=1|jgi:hypothetical protein